MLKRSKKPKIKQEKDVIEENEKDLTYYLRDRVELMHQVFGILKGKELIAMAPDSVRNLGEDDLQELCLEEVLGISSKRLCAILDGAPCPSDTNTSSSESSSVSEVDRESDQHHKKGRKKPQEELETISLDSISSDDSIVAKPEVKKKKHKCHKNAKSVKKDAPMPSSSRQKKQKDQTTAIEKKAADRAGMTVLELLELQARARAIRAQLALEKTVNIKDEDVKSVGSKQSASEVSESEGEVQIKEEPQEVVEIDSGSEDDKKSIKSLKNAVETAKESEQLKKSSLDTSKTLTIRMPLTAQIDKPTTRKVKLIRHKIMISTGEETAKQPAAMNVAQSTQPVDVSNSHTKKSSAKVSQDKPPIISETSNLLTESNPPTKSRKTKQKRQYRKRIRSGERSDSDELIMEVSDGEKLDLFEGSDEPTSSGEDSDRPEDKDVNASDKDLMASKSNLKKANNNVNSKKRTIIKEVSDIIKTVVDSNDFEDKITENNLQNIDNTTVIIDTINQNVDSMAIDDTSKKDLGDDEAVVGVNVIESGIKQIEMENMKVDKPEQTADDTPSDIECQADEDGQIDESVVSDTTKVFIDTGAPADRRSDGELSDAPSSEVEMFEKPQEVLMISDEENSAAHKHKKRKAKNKKSKEKKHKRKDKQEKILDFRQANNQNYFEVTADETISKVGSLPKNDNIIDIDDDGDIHQINDETRANDAKVKNVDEMVASRIGEFVESNKSILHTEENPCSDSESINVDFDDVIEILEISDESSSDECNSGSTKKLTTEDIIALGVKIEKQIEDEDALSKQNSNGTEEECVDNLPSWKERWLTSSKVQRVMTTSSILNALRKKNKELKKKLVMEKMQVAERVPETAELTASPVKEIANIEGTVELYNTLTSRNVYSEPLQHNAQTETPVLAQSMAKDAKHLLKMYKKLLKAHGLLTKEDKKKIKAEKRSLKQLAKGQTARVDGKDTLDMSTADETLRAVLTTEKSVLLHENRTAVENVTLEPNTSNADAEGAVNLTEDSCTHQESIRPSAEIEANIAGQI